MPAFIQRFFAWIGSLMRRRHFIASRTVTPPPPPPIDLDNLSLLFLLLSEEM